MYDNSTSQIGDSLLGNHPTELKVSLQQRIDNSIVKNNLYVEFEFKAINHANFSGKEILTLTPNIYGIGVNLKELWSKHFTV